LIAAAIEFAKAGDNVGDVFPGGLDVTKVFFSIRGETGFSARQQIGKTDDR